MTVSGTVDAIPTIGDHHRHPGAGYDDGRALSGLDGNPIPSAAPGSLPGILITAPTGVELSDDGGTSWSSSLDLSETDGAVGTRPAIDARIATSAAVGIISGSITNTGGGATEQDVSVSGTVNAVPTVTISTDSLDLGTTTAGTAGSAKFPTRSAAPGSPPTS